MSTAPNPPSRALDSPGLQPFSDESGSAHSLLARVEALYNTGLCLDAWEAGKVLGPLWEWPGLEGRQLAGRLAHHLGAPRLSAYLHVANFRANPRHPSAQYFHLYDVQARRGSLRAWAERRSFGPPPAGIDTLENVADYHGQCAQLLGSLRDFERAEDHLRHGRRPDNARPYWFSERAMLFELEDRFHDALAVAREGLAASPHYPPCIHTAAHCMEQLELYDESLGLLRDAATTSQSSGVIAILIRLLIKLRRYDEVLPAMERFESLTPLREKALADWMVSVRAEIAGHLGDYETVLEIARSAPPGPMRTVAESVERYLKEQAVREKAPRIELPVPFVRQHHATCAPATLSAISRFWNKPADHLGIAEEICYDGTYAHNQRRWATTNGWAVREFSVDWNGARALIDDGIPFTLEVSDVAGGHLQAVIGYDEPAGTILIRDPNTHETLEFTALAMLQQHSSTGPRGLALVPAEDEARLSGLELPESRLYDPYYHLLLALDEHRRADAAASYQEMRESQPEHRLTLHARRALAAYDNNATEALAAIDALLNAYPHDQRLQLDRLNYMRPISTHADRLAWLAAAAKHGPLDAVLLIEQSRELIADDRQMPAAMACVRAAMRQRPDDPRIIYHFAELMWRTGDRDEALELFRLAACSGDKTEDFSQAYFNACVWTRNAEAGFTFLRARVDRIGAQSPQPSVTLFTSLQSQNRVAEALEVLDAAVALHPEDGDLRIFAARQCATFHRPEAALEHLAVARQHARHTAWLAESAWQAQLRGEREGALALWRQIADVEPLHLEAHRMIALLLSEMSGRAAALVELEAICGRFPQHAMLHQLWYDWTAGDAAADRERVLRRLLAIEPAHAWAVRELALNLSSQSRFDEALRAADEGVALDVSHSAGVGIRALILQTIGRNQEAADLYRQSLRLWIDYSEAMSGLLDTAGETLAQRKDTLAFIRAELESQPVIGDGVLAFRSLARGILTPDEVLDALRLIHRQRPETWQTLAVLVQHLTDMGGTHLDEALALARTATERFPHAGAPWYDLARVHRIRNEPAEENAALDRCLELTPNWTEAILAKADALERSRQLQDAARLLESATHRTPLAVELRSQLAEVVHRSGDVERAIAIVREAIRVNADVELPWRLLADWLIARHQDQGVTELLEFARGLAEKRPAEARVWMRLADLERRAGQREQALATVERVLGMHSGNIDGLDFKALVLAELRRFRDAEEICRVAAGGGAATHVLDGRAAWVDAQRGDLPAAIVRLQALVKQLPDRAWAWAQLTEWYSKLGKDQEAAEAAQRWAFLDSRNAVPLGWLGELKLKLGYAPEAREIFQRAMRLQPSYLFAGLQLVQIEIAAKDYDTAAHTLDVLTAHAPREFVMAARVELESARNRKAEALAIIRELCSTPQFERDALNRGVNALNRTEWQRGLEKALRLVIKSGTHHVAAPALWARARIRRGLLGSLRWYRRLARMGEAGQLAIFDLLEAIGDRARHPQAVGWYLDLHILTILYCCRGWRSNDQYWGKVGYALVCRSQYRLLARWMRDWRTRPAVEPWMLQNLTVGMMARHRDKEGLELLRHLTTTMAHGVDVGETVRLWGALAACAQRDLELAERLLHETPPVGLLRGNAPMREFAVECLGLLKADGVPFAGKHRAAYAQAVTALKKEHAGKRLAALALRTVARHVKQPRLKWRAWFDLNEKLATAGIVGLVLVLIVLISL